MRLLSWLLGLPIALIAVLFAVANREAVALSLWPLPFAVDAPLSAALLVFFVVGLLLGGLVAWASAGRWRRLARKQTRRVTELERQMAQTPPPASVPVLSGPDIIPMR